MTKAVVPIQRLGQRMQEQGRIRIGMKGPKGQPVALDTFRFTSIDEDAISQVAAQYGGTVGKWHEPKANHPDQFEVVTEASEIAVWIGQGGLTQNYELWSGGGIKRRCDGIVCTVTRDTPDGPSDTDTDCICGPAIEDGAPMECVPKTRFTVILPEIRFGGGWRIETSSWNAAQEMPGMERMIANLEASDIVAGKLTIAYGKTTKGGQTKRYRYPRLILDYSPSELMAGEGTIKSIPASAKHTAPALTEGATSAVIEVETVGGPPASVAEAIEAEFEVVEAEVVLAEEWKTKGAAIKELGNDFDQSRLKQGNDKKWRIA